MRFRRTFVFVLGAAAVLEVGFIAGTYAQRSQLPVHGFLQSTGAVIQLGVWDKLDVADSDKATYIVTATNGKQFKAERNESLDDWVYVTFPEDFSPYPSDTTTIQTYRWKCVVGGETVAGGTFKWGNGQADDNNRNIK